MKKFCKVKGKWTKAFSKICTLCRYYSPEGCQKEEYCKFQTTNSNALFIGKKVKDVSDDALIFEDESVLNFKKAPIAQQDRAQVS